MFQTTVCHENNLEQNSVEQYMDPKLRLQFKIKSIDDFEFQISCFCFIFCILRDKQYGNGQLLVGRKDVKVPIGKIIFYNLLLSVCEVFEKNQVQNYHKECGYKSTL